MTRTHSQPPSLSLSLAQHSPRHHVANGAPNIGKCIGRGSFLLRLIRITLPERERERDEEEDTRCKQLRECRDFWDSENTQKSNALPHSPYVLCSGVIGNSEGWLPGRQSNFTRGKRMFGVGASSLSSSENFGDLGVGVFRFQQSFQR